MAKNLTVNVEIADDWFGKIELEAKKQNISMEALVFEAVQEYIQRRSKNTPPVQKDRGDTSWDALISQITPED